MSEDFLEFFLVWSPTGSAAPSHRHHTEAAARNEAERLARMRPGNEFFVLRTVAMVGVTEMVRSEARTADYLAVIAPESLAYDVDLLEVLRESTPPPGSARSPAAPEPTPPTAAAPSTDEDIPF